MDDLKGCSVCGQRFGAAVLVLTSEGIACPRCATSVDEPTPMKLPATVIAAAVVAVIPFFLRLSVSHLVLTGDGLASRESDYLATSCGAVALLAGGYGLLVTMRAQPRKPAHLGMAAAVLAVAAFHLVRGLGLLG